MTFHLTHRAIVSAAAIFLFFSAVLADVNGAPALSPKVKVIFANAVRIAPEIEEFEGIVLNVVFLIMCFIRYFYVVL